MPSLRLFIAIETPPTITPQLAAIRDRLKACNADVKWEPDEKLHVTLKFLGATDEGLLPQIVYNTEGVARRYQPLEARYGGIGCFPNKRSPRIVWIGMEDLNKNLELLQRNIEACLIPLGFKPEDRRFHAHVTLGRVKSSTGLTNLLRIMDSITFESQPVSIHEIAVVKSVLNPNGSEYTTLKRIQLAHSSTLP